MIEKVNPSHPDKVADRIKNKYFNGETFPEIPPEHYDDAQ